MTPEELIATLPPVRGAYRAHASVAKVSWFQVGGAADVLYKPADVDDLAYFMAHKENVPVTILGVGSNLLIRDGGIRGVVVRLGKGFTSIEQRQDGLYVGAGALSVHVARFARDEGISGLEFLVGIPGCIGGAVAMNAGAYGSETAVWLQAIEIVTKEGDIRTMSPEEVGFSYRMSRLPEGSVVTRAVFKNEAGDRKEIAARMDAITQKRETTQPVRSRTSGCSFKNPQGAKSAWQLIDEAGCRGLIQGGATISEKHCNFMINQGDATAEDLETLGEAVRKRVLDTSGVLLEWEIQRIGDK